MSLAKLGYSKNWVKFKFITKESVEDQTNEFKLSEDPTAELLRFDSFMNWIESRNAYTQDEIDQFLILALEDEDPLMAGAAVRELFSSTDLSHELFNYMITRLPEFGDWTKKLIHRETLAKRLHSEKITMALYQECLNYKNEYDDNRLLIMLIPLCTKKEILLDFKVNGCGKRIRTMAEKKINKLLREEINHPSKEKQK